MQGLDYFKELNVTPEEMVAFEKWQQSIQKQIQDSKEILDNYGMLKMFLDNYRKNNSK